ncbi:MAG: hypothetical protein LBS24_08300, partial [Clostridiales Family XIII bacterium]|nr:hypothetical protein [Clostridiales Family XIII bacterium]
IEDERLQTFVITGLLVASDKFANREYLNTIRRWIGMTKMGQIIQEEIEAACAAARAETATVRAEAAATAARAAARDKEIAKNLLRKGMDISDIVECTGLARADVEMLLLN